MRGRDEVYVVAPAGLQCEHDLGKPLVSDLILQLNSVRLGDLIVLTVNAAKIAVAKEDVA
jgi:hypothetical protein